MITEKVYSAEVVKTVADSLGKSIEEVSLRDIGDYRRKQWELREEFEVRLLPETPASATLEYGKLDAICYGGRVRFVDEAHMLLFKIKYWHYIKRA